MSELEQMEQRAKEAESALEVERIYSEGWRKLQEIWEKSANKRKAEIDDLRAQLEAARLVIAAYQQAAQDEAHGRLVARYGKEVEK